jgi:hypothetical protein
MPGAFLFVFMVKSLCMEYQINTLVATVVKKDDAPKGSVGAIIGVKPSDDGKDKQYLVELFTITSHLHDQIYYSKDEIYAIQQ